MTAALAGLLVWGGILAYVAFVRGEGPAPEDRTPSGPRSSVEHRRAGPRPSTEEPQRPAHGEEPAVPSLAADAGSYSIAGVIRDCATQGPVSGARLQLTVALEVGLHRAHETSDSSGAFQFVVNAAVTSQAAVLDAEAPGYATGHWQVRDGESGKTYCLNAGENR